MSLTKRLVLTGGGVIIGLILLVAGFVLLLRIGPRAPVPAVDPIIALNAAHADIQENAAEPYEAAWKRLTAFHNEWLEGWRVGQPLPAEVDAWLAENEPARELASIAANRARCWFHLERDANDGFVSSPYLANMRELARLLSRNAGQATAAHDQDLLLQRSLEIAQMARHLDSQAGLIARLVAVAIHDLAVEGTLLPLTWPEFDPADRRDYALALLPVLEPPPPFTNALGFDQNEMAFVYASNTGRTLAGVAGGASSALALLSTPERFAGELRAAMDPKWNLLPPIFQRSSILRVAPDDSCAPNLLALPATSTCQPSSRR